MSKKERGKLGGGEKGGEVQIEAPSLVCRTYLEAAEKVGG